MVSIGISRIYGIFCIEEDVGTNGDNAYGEMVFIKDSLCEFNNSMDSKVTGIAGFILFDPCWLYPDTMMIHAVDDRLSIPITSNGGFLKMGYPKWMLYKGESH